MFSKFIIRSTLFLALIWGALTLMAWIVDKGLRQSKHPLFFEWNAIRAGNIHADVIINGSSRARHHVSTAILDTALDINSYNLGLIGHHFDGEYMRYRFYREHNPPPALIIQTLDLFTLTRPDEPFQPMQFAPYLDDTVIQNGSQRINAFGTIDFMIPFAKYRFEDRYLQLGIQEFLFPGVYPSVAYKGYEPDDYLWNEDFDRMRELNPKGLMIQYNHETIDLFREFLREAKDDSIDVVLVYPPEYYELRPHVPGRRDLLKMYARIAQEYNVTFLDYSEHAISFDRKYFYNSTHLNKNGAEHFTQVLARDLPSVVRKRR